MLKSAMIERLWYHSFVTVQKPHYKYLYILLCLLSFSALGLVSRDLKRLAFETGISKKSVEKGLEYFVASGQIIIEKETILVVDFIAHAFGYDTSLFAETKQKASLQRLYRSCSYPTIQAALAQRYPALFAQNALQQVNVFPHVANAFVSEQRKDLSAFPEQEMLTYAESRQQEEGNAIVPRAEQEEEFAASPKTPCVLTENVPSQRLTMPLSSQDMPTAAQAFVPIEPSVHATRPQAHLATVPTEQNVRDSNDIENTLAYAVQTTPLTAMATTSVSAPTRHAQHALPEQAKKN